MVSKRRLLHSKRPPPPSPMESLNPQRGSLLVVESVLGLCDSTLQSKLGLLRVVLFDQVGDFSRYVRGLLGKGDLVVPRGDSAEGVEVGQRVAV